MDSWKTILVLCAVFFVGSCAEPFDQRVNFQEQQKTMGEVMGSIEKFLPSWNDLEDKCRRTKGQEAYDRIRAGYDNITECVTPLLEKYHKYQPNLPQIITDLSNRKTLQSVIDTVCDGFSTIRMCLHPVLEMTLVCLTSIEVKNLKSIRKAVSGGMDYACYNEGARYIELLETGGKECFWSRETDVATCKDQLNHFVDNDMENILEFNNKNCKVLSDVRSCAVTELKQCPDKRPAEIMGEFFAVMLGKLPCDLRPTSSSPTAVISYWMLILVPFLAAGAL